MIPITHVLFDLDDLLIDSEKLFDLMITKILEPYKIEVSNEFKVRMMGKKYQEFIHHMIMEYKLKVSEDHFTKLYTALRPIILKNIDLKLGAGKVVQYFWENDIPMAIATGSCEDSYNLKIVDHPNVFSKMSHVVCSGSDPSVKRTKPAPDVFVEAANRFYDKPMSPRNVLVFDDAANGIKGALAAHMRAVWIPDPSINTSIFQNHPDVTILRSLEEFRPLDFILPAKDNFYIA